MMMIVIATLNMLEIPSMMMIDRQTGTEYVATLIRVRV